MPKYKLIDPKPMGDNDPKYGQTWWSQTHDSDKPVMFNLMTGTVGDGAEIEFEESVNKTSAKGTDYLRLRKVKVLSGGSTMSPTNSLQTPPNDNTKLLELIYDDVQKILKLVDKTPPQDTVVDVNDGPPNLDDIGF